MSVSIEMVMRGQFPEGSANRKIAIEIAAAVRNVLETNSDIRNQSMTVLERLTEGQHRTFPDGGSYQAWGSAHEVFVTAHFHAE